MKVRHFANKVPKKVVVIANVYTGGEYRQAKYLSTLGVRTPSNEISENIILTSQVLVLAYVNTWKIWNTGLIDLLYSSRVLLQRKYRPRHENGYFNHLPRLRSITQVYHENVGIKQDIRIYGFVLKSRVGKSR